MMVTKEQWKALFDAAYVAQVHVGIHADTVGAVDTHYHAEAALREWAQERGMSVRLHEQELGTRIHRYINLRLNWGPEGASQVGNGVLIYATRELVSVPADEQVDEPEMREEPDSNETLGLSQEFSR